MGHVSYHYVFEHILNTRFQTMLHIHTSRSLLPIKGNGYISGDTTLSELLCFLSENVYSKRNEFAPIGRKFFPFRVDPFSEET